MFFVSITAKSPLSTGYQARQFTGVAPSMVTPPEARMQLLRCFTRRGLWIVLRPDVPLSSWISSTLTRPSIWPTRRLQSIVSVNQEVLNEENLQTILQRVHSERDRQRGVAAPRGQRVRFDTLHRSSGHDVVSHICQQSLPGVWTVETRLYPAQAGMLNLLDNIWRHDSVFRTNPQNPKLHSGELSV